MTLLGALVLVVLAGPAPSGPFAGSVAVGEARSEPLPLSLQASIDQGLQHNLAILLAEAGLRRAHGSRWEALSELLPHLSADFRPSRQKINLEAFGFEGFPGLSSPLVGPFNVFDMRAAADETLDFASLWKSRAEEQRVKAAAHSLQDTRALVVLVCGNLYLQALGEHSRIEAARAQLATAKALGQLASDRKQAGLAPSIDVLRAQVVEASREQRLIAAETRFARAKLALVRAIGLPAGQDVELTDRMRKIDHGEISAADAIAHAFAHREDWQAAQAEAEAAETARHGAWGEALPKLTAHADYGRIGESVSGALTTYTLIADVHVPLLQGGSVHGKVLKAEALVEEKRAALAELRGRIDYEVRSALLEEQATRRRVTVAESASALAREQLRQAQDRFETGVASNIDVVQAQEAQAGAEDDFIDALYEQSLAQAALARATGSVESAFQQFSRGE